MKFFNRSSCSIVGTDFLGQFFTSSGHSDWPTDIHSLRQRYNLIYRLPQLQRWLRGEKITSFTAPTKIKKQIEERFKLSNEHITPCGRFFVYTSGRQTQVKKITLFHYTTEKTAWDDSVSFHHQSFPLALTECSCLLYQTTAWGLEELCSPYQRFSMNLFIEWILFQDENCINLIHTFLGVTTWLFWGLCVLTMFPLLSLSLNFWQILNLTVVVSFDSLIAMSNYLHVKTSAVLSTPEVDGDSTGNYSDIFLLLQLLSTLWNLNKTDLLFSKLFTQKSAIQITKHRDCLLFRFSDRLL